MRETILQNFKNTLYKNKHKLSDVKDKIEKVAFDIVKFTGDDSTKLWQIQSCDDGEYIVALYDVESEVKKTASSNPWSVKVSNISGTINIFYKNAFVSQIKASELGIPSEEIEMTTHYLPKSLNENKRLASLVLKQAQSQDIFTKFPELQ